MSSEEGGALNQTSIGRCREGGGNRHIKGTTMGRAVDWSTAEMTIAQELRKNRNKLAVDEIKRISTGVRMLEAVNKKIKGMRRSVVLSEVMERGAKGEQREHGHAGGGRGGRLEKNQSNHMHHKCTQTMTPKTPSLFSLVPIPLSFIFIQRQ